MAVVTKPLALDETLQRVADALEEISENAGETKADKVTGAVAGNFAGLDANGNLTDSGHKPSDYLTANDISGKLNKPATDGSEGQILRVGSNGENEWADVGTPTDAQVGEAVADWLDDHPEATTTVVDGSITRAKLDSTVGGAVDDVSTLKSTVIESTINVSTNSGLPVIGWQPGGMYGATGIDYWSDTKCKTGFIPVTGGDTITFFVHPNCDQTLIVFEFTGNEKTSANINTVTRITDLATGDMRKITVQSGTNYIRIQCGTNPGQMVGRVFMLTNNADPISYKHTKTFSTNDILSGTISTVTGSTVPNSKRIHTIPIHLEPGAIVHFAPGTNITDCIPYFRKAQGADYTVMLASPYWWTSETTFTVFYDAEYVFIFAASDRAAEINPSDFDCTMTISTNVIRQVSKSYPTVDMMLKDEILQTGQVVRTFGFNSVADCGGAYYEIATSVTSNDCTIFQTAVDGLFAKRLFIEPTVWLESLNVENVAFSVIAEILERVNINDVRCNRINTSDTISVGDWDFSFGSINYSGTDNALLIDGVQYHKIKGDSIKAPNGWSGVKVTTTSRNCTGNVIEIGTITAKTAGVAVRPVNGHGVMHNHYRIAFIGASVVGFSTYIPHSLSTYSWEGEELITLNQTQCQNQTNDAVGVAFEISPDPNDGITKGGTITGITFTNLAVESSNIGIKLHCGKLNRERPTACIKSIYINNMRSRESNWTHTFLTGTGWMQDIYIKPTTSFLLHQWKLNPINGTNPIIIDGMVVHVDMYSMIGRGLGFRMGKKFILQRKGGVMNVSGDVDFATIVDDQDETAKTLFYPDEFVFADSLRGHTAHLNLMYLMDKSADGLIYTIPGASDGQAVTVEAEYMYPHKTITLTNTDAETHRYQINLGQGRHWGTDWQFEIVDLGTINNVITVPYDYDEDDE